ncbi:MAG: hypothetical protein QXQ02_00105 [Halobacteria archaeon]
MISSSRKFLTAQRLVRIYDQKNIPDTVRVKVFKLVADQYKKNYVGAQLHKRVRDSLINSTDSDIQDWLPFLLEIIKLVIPLIVALLV